jgi:hypothetical protein
MKMPLIAYKTITIILSNELKQDADTHLMKETWQVWKQQELLKNVLLLQLIKLVQKTNMFLVHAFIR